MRDPVRYCFPFLELRFALSLYFFIRGSPSRACHQARQPSIFLSPLQLREFWSSLMHIVIIRREGFRYSRRMNVCPVSLCLVCMFAMQEKTRTAITATLPSNSSKHSTYRTPLSRRRPQPSEKSAANRLSSTAIASSMGREMRSPRATRLTYDGSTCSLCAILLNRPRQTAWARTPFIAVFFGFILTLCSALA